MTKKIIDNKPIKELSKLLEELNLTEISYREGDFAISVSRKNTQTISQLPHAQTNTDSDSENQKDTDYKNDPRVVNAPMVGTIYLQPEPGSDPFIKIGDKVKKGQTLLIVEAMKTMNDIVADKDGTIKEILVKNEQPVQFDDPLIIVE